MCTSPIVVVYKERLNSNDDIKVYGQQHAVLCTCGKCEECLKQYQNDWMVRNLMQFRETAFAVFFTLTYREDSVPFSVNSDTGELLRTVCKRQVQLFLKRFREFRRKRGLSTDFKYFITSEYGPTTLRPHYHGLLHGVRLRDFMEFAAVWRKEYGFTTQREVNSIDFRNALNSARYTAKYCAKGEFENPLVALCLVEPTFHLISKGLGKCYLNERTISYHLALDFFPKRDNSGKYCHAYLQEIANRMRVVIGAFGYHVPRYYREEIFAKRKGLQVAYSDFICQCLITQYEQKLEFVQTDKTPGARAKAVAFLVDQDNSEIDQRAKDARVNVTKFFKHSKI